MFLHLLSSAIWNKPPNPSLFAGLDATTWHNIADMARRQTVSALIADKALSLPNESLPPTKLRLQFMAIIQQTEATNRKMIQVLSRLSQEYQEAGFPFCLLKGLGNGANYPQPLLRNAGDIDLWLYQKGDYEKSEKWIAQQGFQIADGHHMHYAFKTKGITIENHRRISYFDNKKYDTLFKQWEAHVSQQKNFTTVQIDGLTLKQLPTEMNAFFIYQHLFRHFIHGGIGFRHLCDWLLFLSKHKGDIDAASFTAIAQSYALLYPMQLFARAAVKYLDAPEDIFPFPMIAYNKQVDLIIKDILHSGNFGFHTPGKQRPKEKLPGMWFSYKTTVRRSIRFGPMSPEHIRLLPYQKLINRLRIGF